MLIQTVLVLVTLILVAPAWSQGYPQFVGSNGSNRLDNELPAGSVTFTLVVEGTGDYNLGGANFFMKCGTTADESVTLTVYPAGSPGSPEGSGVTTNAAFRSQFPDGQNWAYRRLDLSSAVNLAVGTYTLELTSAADPEQNEAYFVKGVGESVTVPGDGGDPPPPPDVPDLTVSKSANPEAYFVQGQPATYTILVQNIGDAATDGSTITVTDTLDSNLTYVPTAGGSGWTCVGGPLIVTCTSNAVIPSGLSAPPITLNVLVKAMGQVSVTNNVAVAGGGEEDTSNNSFQLEKPVVVPPAPVVPVPPSIWLTLAGLMAAGLYFATRMKRARAL